MSNRSVNELEHCRSILLRVLSGVSNEQLDFQIFPDSKSIGELLLHVAGFEFVLVSAANLHDDSEPDHELWDAIKPGFAREAGFEPPRRYPLQHYVDLLSRVRRSAIRRFNSGQDNAVGVGDAFPIGRLVQRLRSADARSEDAAYEKLSRGIKTSFADDGAVEAGKINLISTLQLHESYHRGQITFQKYLYVRHLGASKE